MGYIPRDLIWRPNAHLPFHVLLWLKANTEARAGAWLVVAFVFAQRGFSLHRARYYLWLPLGLTFTLVTKGMLRVKMKFGCSKATKLPWGLLTISLISWIWVCGCECVCTFYQHLSYMLVNWSIWLWLQQQALSRPGMSWQPSHPRHMTGIQLPILN